MKFFGIILGIVVILSWIFVIKEYQSGNKEKTKTKNMILIAFLLTLIMTIMQLFY